MGEDIFFLLFTYSMSQSETINFPREGLFCPVENCRTIPFRTYRQLVRHWKIIHMERVTVSQCIICHKSFLQKAAANAHIKYTHRGGIASLWVPNRRYIHPGNTRLPEPPRAVNPPSPREVAAQQRRMILQEAEQGLLAQRVNKPGPINNRDEEITFHGTKAFRSPVASWLPWLHEAPVEIILDYVDDTLDE